MEQAEHLIAWQLLSWTFAKQERACGVTCTQQGSLKHAEPLGSFLSLHEDRKLRPPRANC